MKGIQWFYGLSTGILARMHTATDGNAPKRDSSIYTIVHRLRIEVDGTGQQRHRCVPDDEPTEIPRAYLQLNGSYHHKEDTYSFYTPETPVAAQTGPNSLATKRDDTLPLSRRYFTKDTVPYCSKTFLKYSDCNIRSIE